MIIIYVIKISHKTAFSTKKSPRQEIFAPQTSFKLKNMIEWNFHSYYRPKASLSSFRRKIFVRDDFRASKLILEA